MHEEHSTITDWSCFEDIEAIEKANSEHYDYPEYDESYDEAGPSRLKKRGFEPDQDLSVKDSKCSSLAKKVKPNEICCEIIDDCLANNVTDVNRKGIDNEICDKTVKDETCPRPGNCEGLMVARMNKLV